MGCQEAVPMVRMFVIFYLGCPLSEGGFGQSHLEVLGCFGVSDSFVFLACTCDAFWKEELHVCFVTSRGREQDFYGKDGGLILASKIEWRQSLNPDHPVLKVCTMCIHVSLSCCVLAPKKKSIHQKQYLPFPTKTKVRNQPSSCWPCSGDPFLPECPVIGLNPSAQALTGWAAAGAMIRCVAL